MHVAAFKHLDSYPSEFLGVKNDGKVVCSVMKKEFPTYHSPADLATATASGSFLVPTPSTRNQPEILLPPFHPIYLAMRFDKVIHDRAMTRLMTAWVSFIDSPVKFEEKKKENRSSSPALHLGVWEITSSTPYITSQSKHQHPTAIVCMDNFLLLVKEFVGPKIRRLLDLHSPRTLERQMK